MSSLNKQILEEQATKEKALLLLAEFGQMQPYLTIMAKGLTRNAKTKVKLYVGDSPQSMTDGETIYIVPYSSMYEVQAHHYRVCDLRDAMWQQRCPECRRREEVMTLLLHEVAHIVEKSFMPVQDWTRTEQPWSRAEWLSDEQKANISHNVNLPDWDDVNNEWVVKDYATLADHTGKFLQFTCNILEDMRIERAMGKVRANTPLMMRARHMRILIDSEDAGKSYYSKLPLNFQILVALLFIEDDSEFALEKLFAPRIVKDLSDPWVKNFLLEITATHGMDEVFDKSIDLYNRLVALGYFEQPEPEPTPEPEPEEDQAEPDEDTESDDKQDEAETRDGGEQEDENPGEGASPEGEGSEEQDDQAPDEQQDDSEPEGDDESEGDASDEAESGEGDEPDESGGNDGDDLDDGEPQPGDSDGGDSQPDEVSSDPQEGAGSAEDDILGGAPSDGPPPGPSSGEEGEPGESSSNSGPDDGWDDQDQSEEGTDDHGDSGEPDDDEEGDSDNDSERQSSYDGSDGSDDARDDPEGSGTDGEDAPADDEGDSPEDMGDAEDLREAFARLLGHVDKDGGNREVEEHETELADQLTRDEINRLAKRPQEFKSEESAVKIVTRYNWIGNRWINQTTGKGEAEVTKKSERYHASHGALADIVPDSSIYGQALMRLKLVLEKNARGAKQGNLKKGKVNPRVLGKRAPLADPRLFQNKSLPKKRDWVVCLHLDISSSTTENLLIPGTRKYENVLTFEKRAMYAQAELLARLGIKFMIMAGTGTGSYDSSYKISYENIVYNIKKVEEPWDDQAKERLLRVHPNGGNIDGHAMMIALWELMKHKSTDKILMYYTDGELPAANAEEEMEVIKVALATAIKNNIHMMGVGVRTDSPKAHGLDTVQIDTPDDLSSVVNHLGRVIGS